LRKIFLSAGCLDRNKTKRFLSLVSLLILVGFSLLVWQPIHAQTIQTVTLPAGTPDPWQMDYDGNRYVYFAGVKHNVLPNGTDLKTGHVVKIDTQRVLADPAGATQSWEVAPQKHPQTGSAYAASVGVCVGNGYVWITSAYSGGDESPTELLSRFNPGTLEVKQYWLTKDGKSIRAVRCDGAGDVWVAAQKIVKFNIAAETFTFCTPGLGVYDLLVDGSILWATAPLPRGIIRFDMVTSTYTNYVPSSHPTMLAKDSSGDIWFSMSQAHKVGKLKVASGAISEYDTGLTEDGPCGVCFDDTEKLWVMGYWNKKILTFDPVSTTVIGQYATTGRPYHLAKGSSGALWYWGQGSVDLGRINTPYVITHSTVVYTTSTFTTLTVPTVLFTTRTIATVTIDVVQMTTRTITSTVTTSVTQTQTGTGTTTTTTTTPAYGTYTLTVYVYTPFYDENGNLIYRTPQANVDTRICLGYNVVASGYTNAQGRVSFSLQANTYSVWIFYGMGLQKSATVALTSDRTVEFQI